MDACWREPRGWHPGGEGLSTRGWLTKRLHTRGSAAAPIPCLRLRDEAPNAPAEVTPHRGPAFANVAMLTAARPAAPATSGEGTAEPPITSTGRFRRPDERAHHLHGDPGDGREQRQTDDERRHSTEHLNQRDKNQSTSVR